MISAVPIRSESSALILGGGRGTRMGGTPKAMLTLGGQTLLERSVEMAARFAGQIIVGLPAELVSEGQDLVGADAVVLAGGETRQQTLDNLLAAVTTPLVIIHDVARPFATERLWRQVVEVGSRCGAAAPVLPIQARDSMATIDGDWLGHPVDRANVGLIQTPYVFTTDHLRSAIDQAKADGVVETSITTLITRTGGRVAVVTGETDNIKITYQEDWEAAIGR